MAMREASLRQAYPVKESRLIRTNPGEQARAEILSRGATRLLICDEAGHGNVPGRARGSRFLWSSKTIVHAETSCGLLLDSIARVFDDGLLIIEFNPRIMLGPRPRECHLASMKFDTQILH
jgi:hypothetical protein